MEIEVTGEGVVGQLSPAHGGQVIGETAAGAEFDRAGIDEVGCFILGPPPPGPVRLRCRTGDRTLVTDWICVS